MIDQQRGSVMKKKNTLLILFSLFLFVQISAEKAVLYIDVSPSMKGYITNTVNDNPSFYKYLFSQFRDILLECSIDRENVNVKQVGTSIENCLNCNITNYGIQKELYMARGTNLVKAVKDMNIDDINILITDGILSLPTQEGQSIPGNCETSSDVVCFKEALRDQIIENQAGFNIIGIKNRFNGTLWLEFNNSVQESQSKIDIDKVRPFYIFLISKNQKKIKELMKGISDRFKKYYNDIYPVEESGEKYRELTIFPIDRVVR